MYNICLPFVVFCSFSSVLSFGFGATFRSFDATRTGFSLTCRFRGCRSFTVDGGAVLKHRKLFFGALRRFWCVYRIMEIYWTKKSCFKTGIQYTFNFERYQKIFLKMDTHGSYSRAESGPCVPVGAAQLNLPFSYHVFILWLPSVHDILQGLNLYSIKSVFKK